MSEPLRCEPPTTLVATKAIVEHARAPGRDGGHPQALAGLDPEPRWSAARLPIVERDSYEISGEIAHGGVGRILRGRSVHLDRPVAIKELLEPGDAAVERFVCEALLTARLQHPAIVPVYEAGRWPSGELFYAMKLVSGRSLADVLAPEGTTGDTPPFSMGETPKPPAQPSPLSSRLALLPHVIAVAEAIAYAHSERIIHRDLKPANILVGSFGETVVIDWGLAKDLAEEAGESTNLPGAQARPATPRTARGPEPYRAQEGLTLAGAVMGTPAYMPPEQARGAAVDERADVYALGAILYHVLAGVPAYGTGGRDARDVLRAVAAGPPPPLEQREPALSLDLCTIVNKAMAHDPAGRYPSARELAADLVRFAAGQVVGAHKYTRGELARRFARRYRAPLAVAAAALVALSAAIGVGFHRTSASRDRAEKERRSAVAARHDALRHADDLTLVQARTSASREPDRALGWLSSLSPAFDRWSAARTIAADARTHGLGSVLRGHTESLNSLAFSPDGRLVATTSDDRTARLWELGTGRSHVLAGHTNEVWYAQFSPDGRHVATSGKDQTIRLWDVATRASRLLLGHEGSIVGLSFLPDQRRLVSVGTDRRVRLWELASGESRVLGRHEASIQAFACSRDGRLLATGSLDGEIRVWDLESDAGRLLGKGLGETWTVAWSPDGQTLASRGYSGGTILWDLAGKRTVLFDPGSQGAASMANGLVFSPDGKVLAFGGTGSTLVLADLATGAQRTLDGREGKVGALAFSPDGRRIAAGSAGGPVQIWDLDNGTARSLHGFDDLVISLAFSPDGRTLAAASFDHTARLFPVESSDVRVLGAQREPLTFTAFSPAGDVLATADRAGVVRLWDVARAGPSDPVLAPGHTGTVYRGAWSPDGSLLATLGAGALVLHDRWGEPRRTLKTTANEWHAALTFSSDGRRLAWSAPVTMGGPERAPQPPPSNDIGLLDLDTGEDRVLSGNLEPVAALAFSPDGSLLASGSQDGATRLWPLDQPGEVRLLGKHLRGVASLAFSPDGRTLASGGRDHTLRLWDVPTGQGRVIDAGGGGVEQIVFSPDGATVYTASAVEAGVRVWDALTGLPRGGGLLRGHEGGTHRFALSADGTRLATAAVDRAVRLWDLASGESRALHGHGAAVIDVAFSPDGRTLASAGVDGTARLWRDDLPYDPEELKAWIRDALGGVPPAVSTPASQGLGAGGEVGVHGGKGS